MSDAGVDRQAVVVQHAAQLASVASGVQLELQQLQHLRVAVLLDDVDALVRVDERVELVGERDTRAAGSTRSRRSSRSRSWSRLSSIAQCDGAVGDEADLRASAPSRPPAAGT